MSATATAAAPFKTADVRKSRQNKRELGMDDRQELATQARCFADEVSRSKQTASRYVYHPRTSVVCRAMKANSKRLGAGWGEGKTSSKQGTLSLPSPKGRGFSDSR